MDLRKVIIAFENPINSTKIQESVESAGVAGCVVCRSAAEVKRVVRKQRLDTIICGFKLQEESCEALFHDLPDGCAMLMIGPQNQLELCQTEGIFRLYAPVTRGDLLASVCMLLQFQNRRPSRPGQPPKRSLEDRQLLEQAKAVLMDRHGMTEGEAHRFLQKQSMDHGTKLTDTARLVLSDEAAMG